MADPISWMMMASAAVNAVGQVVEGAQGYQQGKYEAAVAGQNADISRDNAARARRDADLAEEAKRGEVRKSLGRSAAAAAQSGAAGSGPGQGSIGLVLNQAAKEGELDALNIRYGGDTERQTHLMEEAQYRAEQRAAKRRAKAAAISGILGSAAATLSGSASYGQYQAGVKVRKAQAAYSNYGKPAILPTPRSGG